MMFTPVAQGEEAPVIFVGFLIIGFVGIFLLGIVLHIFVYICGGRKGVKNTIKVVIYSATPRLWLGWIPYINYIAVLWSLVLIIFGIREFHEITTARAILSLVIPIIIIFVIAVAIVYMINDAMSNFGYFYG